MKKTVCFLNLSLFVFIFLACSLSLSAQKTTTRQKVDSIALVGKVYDRTTSHHLIGTIVEVLTSDSTVINKAKGGYTFYRFNRNGEQYSYVNDSTSKYNVNIPKVEGNYLIKVSKDGYEPYYLSYALKINRRDAEKEIPDIFLGKQKIKTLEEFTVKASKVKFYNKGDTIVYNADAFALPEGSMLDALVAQMPGVEIKDNKIYVNGRFVESLLLNGKDFFKGNKNVMMKNIGAYAVKDIAVYEKKDEMAYVLGDREDVEKEYVMDVRLKKDYMTGYMINAEAGGGTDSRYIGRLFTMQYTNNTRLALYGNANNINKADNLSDGRNEVWIDSEPGLNRRINGGIDYRADNSRHTWEVTGNVDATYNNNKNDVITNSVNYLQTVDNYDFSDVNSRAKNFSLATRHNFKLKKKKWNMALKPKFSYNKNRRTDETIAATFNEEMQDINRDIIKAIYTGDNRLLREALINRNLKIYESDAHGYDAQFNGETRFKVPGSPDGIAIKFQTKYSRNTHHGNTLQDICYGGGPSSSMLMQRFSSTRPEYNFNIQGLGRYYFNIPVGSLHASYEFAHTQTRKNSDIALLEAMADNDMAEFAPDALPVPDYANSYTSKLYKNEHRIKLMWYYDKKFTSGKLSISLEPNFIIEDQHLYYHRGDVTADPSRTYLKFNIPDAEIRWSSKDNKQRYSLSYVLQQKPVNLVNLVDIRNTTDPLNIILGNPDLKNATNHRISFNASLLPSKKLSHYLRFYAFWTDNEMVSGYRYDTQTGVRTSKTYNVSGNHDMRLTYSIDWDFGKMDNFILRNYITGGLQQYANMIGNDAEPTKQTVNNRSIDDYLSIGYRIPQKMGFSVGAEVHINNSKSDGMLPVKNNSGYVCPNAIFWLDLPFNLSIESNLKVHKRFGYIEDSMNSTDVLWNAEISYSFCKKTWRISMTAYDILNQMKGVTYSVNAQGRTQTLNTVLPRYFMLTLAYRFDFKPKRKH